MTATIAAFGNYRLLEKIGEGPVGEAFRAARIDGPAHEQMLALKRVYPPFARDPVFARGFLQGAARARKLSHPNLATVLDHGEHQGNLFVVTEHRAGVSLAQIMAHLRLRREPLAPHFVVLLMLQLCEGLQVAHRAQADKTTPWPMVHGDLKPSNILVDEDGFLTLLDLGTGLAGAVEPEGPLVWLSRESIRFLAPEQALGGELDARSDVYALGVLMFELLTLEPLIEQAAPFEMLRQVTELDLLQRLKLLKEYGIDSELARVVQGTLQRKPKARFPDAGALADALSELELPSLQAPGDFWSALIASIDGEEEGARLEFPVLHLLSGDSEDSLDPWDLCWMDDAFCSDAAWRRQLPTLLEAGEVPPTGTPGLAQDPFLDATGGIMLLGDEELGDEDAWDEVDWSVEDPSVIVMLGQTLEPPHEALSEAARGEDRAEGVEADADEAYLSQAGPLELRAEDLEDTSEFPDYDDGDDEPAEQSISRLGVEHVMPEQDLTAFELALARLEMQAPNADRSGESSRVTLPVESAGLDALRGDVSGEFTAAAVLSDELVELEGLPAEEEPGDEDTAGAAAAQAAAAGETPPEEESTGRKVLTAKDLAASDFMTTELPGVRISAFEQEAEELEAVEVEVGGEEDDLDGVETHTSEFPALEIVQVGDDLEEAEAVEAASADGELEAVAGDEDVAAAGDVDDEALAAAGDVEGDAAAGPAWAGTGGDAVPEAAVDASEEPVEVMVAEAGPMDSTPVAPDEAGLEPAIDIEPEAASVGSPAAVVVVEGAAAVGSEAEAVAVVDVPAGGVAAERPSGDLEASGAEAPADAAGTRGERSAKSKPRRERARGRKKTRVDSEVPTLEMDPDQLGAAAAAAQVGGAAAQPPGDVGAAVARASDVEAVVSLAEPAGAAVAMALAPPDERLTAAPPDERLIAAQPGGDLEALTVSPMRDEVEAVVVVSTDDAEAADAEVLVEVAEQAVSGGEPLEADLVAVVETPVPAPALTVPFPDDEEDDDPAFVTLSERIEAGEAEPAAARPSEEPDPAPDGEDDSYFEPEAYVTETVDGLWLGAAGVAGGEAAASVGRQTYGDDAVEGAWLSEAGEGVSAKASYAGYEATDNEDDEAALMEVETLSVSDVPIPAAPSGTIDLVARQIADGRREEIPVDLQLPGPSPMDLPSLGFEIEALGAEDTFETLEASEEDELEAAEADFTELAGEDGLESDDSAVAAVFRSPEEVTTDPGARIAVARDLVSAPPLDDSWESLKTPGSGVPVGSVGRSRVADLSGERSTRREAARSDGRMGRWFRPVARRPELSEGAVLQGRYRINQLVLQLSEKVFYEVAVQESDNARMCYVCGYANNLIEDTLCYKCKSPLISRRLNLSMRWDRRRIERDLLVGQKVLDHPGIARIYEQFIEDGMLFRVLDLVTDELATGVLLSQVGGPLELGPLADIGMQSAQALNFLHDKGISCPFLAEVNIYLHNGRVQLYDLDVEEVMSEGTLPVSMRIKDVMALARVLIRYLPPGPSSLVTILREAAEGRVVSAGDLARSIATASDSPATLEAL